MKVFKPIPGYEGYMATEDGRIWSCKRDKFLCPARHKRGYLQVHTTYGVAKVHRLIALAFIPNPSNFPCINHKDEDKENNRADNLEWCTVSYNNAYGIGAENRKKNVKEKFDKYRLLGSQSSSIPVVNLTTGKSFRSIKSAARSCGRISRYSCEAISRACRGLQKTAYGCKWGFVPKVGAALGGELPSAVAGLLAGGAE